MLAKKQIFKTCLLAAVLLGLLSGQLLAIDSFEGANPPDNWTVSGGGSIATSTYHYKDGSKSLKWNWVADSNLRAEDPYGLTAADPCVKGGMTFWVYNTSAVDANLTFLIGDVNEIPTGTCKYKFDFNLNFEGWRAGWVRFDSDANNSENWGQSPAMHWLYIQAPSSGSGQVFIDMVSFTAFVDGKRSADYQLPLNNDGIDPPLTSDWQQTYKWSQEQPEDSPPGSVTQAQKNDFNTIKNRFSNFLLGGTLNFLDNIDEAFGTTGDKTIENNGADNETTQVSESSGYRWGGYNAGGTNNIHFDDETDDRVRFRPGANVQGSYIYTVFDPEGGQPPTNPDTVQVDAITFAGSASGLEGTYVRFMVRKASDSTWYLSDSVAAAESVSANVDDLQWTALDAATNTNLNALDDEDEAALSTTGSPGSFSSKVGGAIDGGGFCIGTGTENYFGIDSATWGKIDILKLRYDDLQTHISNGVADYNDYNISISGANVTGTPLFGHMDLNTPHIAEDFGEGVLFPLALDYKLNNVTASRTNFLNGIKHMHDQGWAEGSACGSLDHQANQTAGWVNAIFLMFDEMDSTMQDYIWNSLNWYCDFGEVYHRPFDFKGNSADRFMSFDIPRLMRILLMDINDPNWVRDMNNFVEWLDNAYTPAGGWGGTYKPDYIGYHHFGPQHDTYAANAFHAAAIMTYLLHGTSFALPSDVVYDVNQGLLQYRNYTNKYDAHPGIGGRGADSEDNIVDKIQAYAILADMTADVNNSEWTPVFKRLYDIKDAAVLDEMSRCDTQAGKVWMRTLGASEIVQKLDSATTSAESAPTGNWSYPWGAHMVHRRGDWMASVKGWSRFVVNYEQTNIKPGWYQSHGCLLIFGPDGRIASGMDMENGWDWCKYPGATTVAAANSYLTNKNDRRFSTKTFVGGVTLEDSNGLFALDLDDNLYTVNLTAKKTYFFFDDVIVCLGSGITETSDGNDVVTTLFQGKLVNTSDAIYDNSTTATTSFPYSNSYATSNGIWLVDNYDNGYYIPDEADLNIKKQAQNSVEGDGLTASSGNYAVAWFDHGASPSNADYEYAVVVDTNANNMSSWASSPTYSVLEKSSTAHIVQDTSGDTTTGYAMFASDSDVGQGKLKSVDAPCLVMIREVDANTLKVSLADPNLDVNDGGNAGQDVGSLQDDDIKWNESTPSDIYIVIDGNCTFVGAHTGATIIDANSDANETEIKFDCVDGKTIEIELNYTLPDANWVQLIYDDFEEGFGNWVDGGTDCLLYTGGTYAHDGNNAADLQDNTSTSVMTTGNLAASAYDELKVEFWYYPVSFDSSSEDFWLQISTNGGEDFNTVEEWNLGDEFENDDFYSDSVTITGYNLTDQTQIRFRCDASGDKDDVYIDEVKVSAK